MKPDFAELRRRLTVALDSARDVAKGDKDDFAAGRYDGLKEALAILDTLEGQGA